MPPAIYLYLAFSRFADPLYRAILRNRAKSEKEDTARIDERFGRSSRLRPDGKLAWFHAASVGESQALRGPIEKLLQAHADLNVLVTTTTRSSASLLENQLPDRAFHQFSPVDTATATKAFLDHWQPDVAVWTESEVWPQLILETSARQIPMHLINARISPQTGAVWRRWPRTLQFLMSCFRTISVQDRTTEGVILDLGVPAEKIALTGSTKAQAAALGCDETELAQLIEQIGQRKCWVAASTHVGEEEMVLDAHRAVLAEHPDALLIIAPRHPERGDDVAALIANAGCSPARRTAGDRITKATGVYLADTLGEMGLWYRLAPVAFVGGSLVNTGGHNPYEPLALGAWVLAGPHVFNFAEDYSALRNQDQAFEVGDANALARLVMRLWGHPQNDIIREKRLSETKTGNAAERLIARVTDHIG